MRADLSECRITSAVVAFLEQHQGLCVSARVIRAAVLPRSKSARCSLGHHIMTARRAGVDIIGVRDGKRSGYVLRTPLPLAICASLQRETAAPLTTEELEAIGLFERFA